MTNTDIFKGLEKELHQSVFKITNQLRKTVLDSLQAPMCNTLNNLHYKKWWVLFSPRSEPFLQARDGQGGKDKD